MAGPPSPRWMAWNQNIAPPPPQVRTTAHPEAGPGDRIAVVVPHGPGTSRAAGARQPSTPRTAASAGVGSPGRAIVAPSAAAALR